jgi:hypothetical protein
VARESTPLLEYSKVGSFGTKASCTSHCGTAMLRNGSSVSLSWNTMVEPALPVLSEYATQL